MTISKTSFRYLAVAFILCLFIVTCQRTSAQNINQKQIDSVALLQAEANKFTDSLVSNTSLKSFQQYLFEVESAKRYATFLEQYNFFIQDKYNIWIKEKNKPKVKPK